MTERFYTLKRTTIMITDLIDYISFRGEKLTLVWKDEKPFVALRPICERLGLDWKSQYAKVTAPDFGSGWQR
jgi:hypothetical protein